MIVAILISLFLFVESFQTIDAKSLNNISSTIELNENYTNPPRSGGRIIEEPDIDPMFPGGSGAMKSFISSSLQYPREAAEEDIQGLVVYTFVVELDGTLSDFDIIHRAHPLLDAEALRIIKSMPPWKPAVYNGKSVRARNYVPMYFKLNKNAPRSTLSTAQKRKVVPINPGEEVFTIVDQMPQFPTGDEGLGKFISEYIKYPSRAKEENIEGRILCSFIIRKNGDVSNIEVVDGLDYELDQEALRVLSMMPKWSPGKNGGEPVHVKCILPIDIKID